MSNGSKDVRGGTDTDLKIQFDIPITMLKEALLLLGKRANLTIVLSLDIGAHNHTGDLAVGSYALLAVAERLATDLQVDS